ncbi:hypothetical protein CAOG_08535, partial [Capsaspora owczarzaki ATCC 30864]|uniref:hypothetical protein n=1 Tax=Capsaspora owczarzaki (strain ATCC 30864) TaxID=595528 RepID=UPI000352130C
MPGAVASPMDTSGGPANAAHPADLDATAQPRAPQQVLITNFMAPSAAPAAAAPSTALAPPSSSANLSQQQHPSSQPTAASSNAASSSHAAPSMSYASAASRRTTVDHGGLVPPLDFTSLPEFYKDTVFKIYKREHPTLDLTALANAARSQFNPQPIIIERAAYFLFTVTRADHASTLALSGITVGKATIRPSTPVFTFQVHFRNYPYATPAENLCKMFSKALGINFSELKFTLTKDGFNDGSGHLVAFGDESQLKEYAKRVPYSIAIGKDDHVFLSCKNQLHGCCYCKTTEHTREKCTQAPACSWCLGKGLSGHHNPRFCSHNPSKLKRKRGSRSSAHPQRTAHAVSASQSSQPSTSASATSTSSLAPSQSIAQALLSSATAPGAASNVAARQAASSPSSAAPAAAAPAPSAAGPSAPSGAPASASGPSRTAAPTAPAAAPADSDAARIRANSTGAAVAHPRPASASTPSASSRTPSASSTPTVSRSRAGSISIFPQWSLSSSASTPFSAGVHTAMHPSTASQSQSEGLATPSSTRVRLHSADSSPEGHVNKSRRVDHSESTTHVEQSSSQVTSLPSDQSSAPPGAPDEDV